MKISGNSLLLNTAEEFFTKFMKNVLWKSFPKYIEEQYVFRSYICKSCVTNNKCDFCGCTLQSKITDIPSCNKGKRFPDLMSEEKWNDFKQEHNIIIQ